jgi:glycosyltransferase involved in cell wall biosynthesis
MTSVSVIIPTYNQGEYLGDAVLSVLAQSFHDIELVVVDDGSTDNTRKIAQGFTDRRILYLYQENQGLSAARNTGIKNSTGRYLTFLDSDDLYHPEKISLLFTEMESNPELGFIAGQAVPIDQNGRRIGRLFDKPIPQDIRHLLLGNPLHVGSVMLRCSWQERVGLFDESLRSYEDWDMWLRLARAGCQMGWLDQPVSFYRFHPDQMVRNSSQMTEATFAVLDKFFCDPGITGEWLELRDPAYSSANLRAAMQAYAANEFDLAKHYLSEAIRLNKDLITGDAGILADRFAAFADSPKHRNPLHFLEVIYRNLPVALSHVKQRGNKDLGKAAFHFAFQAYQQKDFGTARYAILRALYYQPVFLKNRGLLSILFRSSFPTLTVRRNH